MPLSRRSLIRGTAATIVAGATTPHAFANRAGAGAPAAPDQQGLELGPETPFSFEALTGRAKALAATAFSPAAPVAPDILDAIDYDGFQAIRWKPDMSLELSADGTLPVQLFHLGRTARDSVKIHIVSSTPVSNKQAREILYTPALFDTPADHPSRKLPPNAGFAGFRVMAKDLKTDWLAFLGASYFRTSGPFDHYGLSARGLAIDTGLPTPEEFPRFTEFWLEGGPGASPHVIIYALLDSESITGAYRIATTHVIDAQKTATIPMEIECVLFARKPITRLGIAPFSSMYWYGETQRPATADWRPEIHDSDGLAIWTGAEERLWRPLNNPPRVMTNTFVDTNPKGFGLLQRDREFGHYLDDGVFYERRASVWVEPLDAFGAGSVHLLEIPTDDEIHDNIATYWCPEDPMTAGTERRYRYRLTWLDDVAHPDGLGRAQGLWTGVGGRPGHRRPDGVRKFVIDFAGTAFEGLGREDGVEIVVSASRGEISNAYTHPVERQLRRWRALFDLKAAAGPDPVDLRLFLRKGDRALTETWLYQWFPA